MSDNEPAIAEQPIVENPAVETSESSTAALEAALQKERKSRLAAERKLKAIDPHLQHLDVDQLRSITESQQRLERMEAEWEQRIQQEVEAAKAEALQQVKVKDQKLAEVLAEKSELFRQQALANAFQAAGGRSGGADDGTTYFAALMGAVGPRFKVDDSGELIVINVNGDAMLTDTGDKLSATAYLEQLKSHPVYGHFFAPTSSGHGGGMRGMGNLTSGSLQSMSAMDKISFGLGS